MLLRVGLDRIGKDRISRDRTGKDIGKDKNVGIGRIMMEKTA